VVSNSNIRERRRGQEKRERGKEEDQLGLEVFGFSPKSGREREKRRA